MQQALFLSLSLPLFVCLYHIRRIIIDYKCHLPDVGNIGVTKNPVSLHIFSTQFGGGGENNFGGSHMGPTYYLTLFIFSLDISSHNQTMEITPFPSLSFLPISFQTNKALKPDSPICFSLLLSFRLSIYHKVKNYSY